MCGIPFSLSIHPLMDTGFFYILTIVNNAVMHIGLHVSFSIMVSSGYTPSSGIAGSYRSFMGFPGGSVVKNPSAIQET